VGTQPVSRHAWRLFTFTQVYWIDSTVQGIGPAWTLCIEVTFYLALPLFALAAAKLSRGTRSLRGDVMLLVVLAALALAYRGHFNAFLFEQRVGDS